MGEKSTDETQETDPPPLEKGVRLRWCLAGDTHAHPSPTGRGKGAGDLGLGASEPLDHKLQHVSEPLGESVPPAASQALSQTC